jgi:hypothetical protein
MTREDAARKVRALLATAAWNSGATRPERATARDLAERLIERFDLDEDVRPDGARKFTVTVAFK